MNDDAETRKGAAGGRDDPAAADTDRAAPPADTALAEKQDPGERPPEQNAVERPVVLQTSVEARTPMAAPAGAHPVENAQVHVAPNLLDVTTGRVETAEEKHEAKERRDLDEVVHSMLIVGLVVSTALMLIGIAGDVILGVAIPTVEPDIGQAINSLVHLHPSGFLGLGLLILVATPILRVLGSIFAFAVEKDWRFAGITLLVLCIVMTSILLGKG